MLLLANQLPIHMEILDADDGLISQTAATLHQLDGDRAIVTLDGDAMPAGLFWGARARLRMEDGGERMEVLGTVLESNLRMGRGTGEEGGDVKNPPAVRLRLWDCRSSLEQRLLPRRRVRFALQYIPLAGAGRPAPSSPASATESEETWRRAWCIDIGGGGLRLRVPRTQTPPKSIALRFSLPICDSSDTDIPARAFCLTARVLRAEVVGRQADTLEMAVRFERLTVEEGLALSNFLSRN